MNNIQYDKGTLSHVGGTFSHVVMLGLLSMPVVHAAPNLDVTNHANRLYFLGDSSATFNKYDNFVSDPYASYLIRVDAARFETIIKPRTELGRKLLEYRRAALAKGMRTLSADEINAMIKEGRGASA